MQAWHVKAVLYNEQVWKPALVRAGVGRPVRSGGTVAELREAR